MNWNRSVANLGVTVAASALAVVGAAQAGTVGGTVVDPVSGKPVASANVSILGTTIATVTSADGHFMLQDVPKGTYTVTVSYPGYHDSAAAVAVTDDKTVEVNFNAYTSKLDDVVVVANRYQASAAQLNAVNTIDVLSADDLAHTAVHNVAEALALVPGINVMNTGNSFFGGIDGASRGEGMFASIRGMNSEYNVNLINGIEVAQGQPYSRGVQLSLLPPSGLQTIVVNKTSTADMDGDAIGGTVDFRTPSAFDFNQKTYGSVTVGGQMESRARDYGDSGLGGNAAGEFATKFGDGQFGIYTSAYYDIRHFANSEMGGVQETTGDGAWAYAVNNVDANGKAFNPSNLDPSKNLMTTGFNAGMSTGQTKRYGGNASLDWRPDASTSVYLRGSYAVADTQQNSSLSQVLGRDVSYVPLGTTGLYQPSISTVSTRFWYETNPEHAALATAQLGAEKQIGKWTLAPKLFTGYGVDDEPNHIEISARPLINGGNGFLFGSSTLATYDSNGLPYPLLTPAMYAQLGDPASLPARRAGELTEKFSDQRKSGGQFDARYDIDSGVFDFLKVGVKFVRSERDVNNRDWTTAKFSDGRSFGSLGIIDGSYSSVYPGEYRWSVPKINQNALFNLYRQFVTAGDLDSCSGLTINNLNCNTEHGTESVSSAYAMLNMKFGDVEVLPGIRFEHSQLDNTFWVTPYDANGNELPGNWGSNSTTYSRALPSLFVNYRPESGVVYRGSIWTSYTRPPFVQLGGGSQTSVSADGTTTIKQGNPHLKPIGAVNLDLSGEWSSTHGGNAVLALFGKQLSNYIYDNGSNQVDPASVTSGSGNVRITEPTNGGSGHVYGLELALRQKFQDLPAPLDGFGVGGNVTRQTTQVNLGVAGLDSKERIQNAPDWLANAEVFYEKQGYSVDVIYHYSGASVAQYDLMNLGASWDDLWIRAAQRVDLHVGYKYDDSIRVDLSIANVFKNITYWSHVGENSFALSDVVDSGRTALLTVKYIF